MSKRRMNKEGNKTKIKVSVVRKTSFRLKVIKISYCLRYVRMDFTLYKTDFFFLSLFRPTIDGLRNFLIALSAGKLYQRRLMKNIPQSGLRGY